MSEAQTNQGDEKDQHAQDGTGGEAVDGAVDAVAGEAVAGQGTPASVAGMATVGWRNVRRFRVRRRRFL